jgi:hypothetical protein
MLTFLRSCKGLRVPRLTHASLVWGTICQQKGVVLLYKLFKQPQGAHFLEPIACHANMRYSGRRK